jgi:hypothetical protein
MILKLCASGWFLFNIIIDDARNHERETHWQLYVNLSVALQKLRFYTTLHLFVFFFMAIEVDTSWTTYCQELSQKQYEIYRNVC